MAASKFGGVGRPDKEESLARRAEFLRLLADGMDCGEAIERSRINAKRAAVVLAELVRPLLAKAA